MNRVHLAFCVLIFGSLSATGLAKQDQATPVVTTAAPVEKVRFAGSPMAVQLRIEVRSAGGTLVYDSDWKDGNILDWLPQDSSGQPLAYGVYRLMMRSKNLAGQASEKQASLHVDSGGMAVDDEPRTTPKITLTAHDGETGELITTTGDLSFRFGDFLNRNDTEAMRLTKEGNLGIGTDKPQAPLDVNGLIRTSKGIMFPDGTILTTAAGFVASGPGDGGSVMRQRPSAPSTPNAQNRAADVRQRVLLLNPPAVSAPPLTPRPNAGPANQFVVDSAGVHIGTTSAFGLDVAGDVTLASNLNLPPTSSPAAGVLKIGGNTFAHSYGTGNVFLGTNAGNFVMTGTSNTATGYAALGFNTTGSRNTANGYDTLLFTNYSTSNDNTAIGYEALYANTTGFENTAVGSLALFNSQHAGHNTAVGYQALYSTSNGTPNGDLNVAVGDHALYGNTTGYSNVAIGVDAGGNITAGNLNIDIANSGVAGDSNTIRIGDVSQTRAFIAGIRGVTTGSADGLYVLVDSNGQLGTASSSARYKFDIHDMSDATDDLMRLRPVTFRYIAHGDNAPIQYGLIAEEVAAVYPELVTTNNDGQPDAVMYQFLAPMLLNEVQKQHRQIEEQQKTIDALNTTLAQLMHRVEQLEGKRNTSK